MCAEAVFHMRARAVKRRECFLARRRGVKREKLRLLRSGRDFLRHRRVSTRVEP